MSVFTAATVANAPLICTISRKVSLLSLHRLSCPTPWLIPKLMYKNTQLIGQDIAREVVGVVVSNIQSNGAIIRSIRGAA